MGDQKLDDLKARGVAQRLKHENQFFLILSINIQCATGFGKVSSHNYYLSQIYDK
jgi:hypothetical protein